MTSDIRLFIGEAKLPSRYSPESTPRILLLLMAIGLSACIGLAVHNKLGRPPLPSSDAREYDSYAWNLAQGHGFRGISPDVKSPEGQLLEHPSAYRAPGTSLLWAILYWSLGHRYSAVRIAHCLMHMLTIPLIYGIGRICFRDSVALFAAAIYSVWPTALFYSSDLGSEPLYTLLFSWFIFRSLKFAEVPTWPRAVAAGAFLGLALLTRGNAVVMVALLVPWSVWQFRTTPRFIVRGLSVALIALVMLVPWTIRNYWVLHSFVPFETGGGDVLLGSYNRVVATDPAYYGYWVYPTSELPEYREQITAANNEVVRDHVEIHLAIQWVRSHPDKWCYLAQSRFRRSLTPFLDPQTAALYPVGILITWGPVLILFSIGFFPSAIWFLRSGHPGWVVHLGISHFVLTALIFWGASRFRYPVEGLCIILACATAMWFWERIDFRPDLHRLKLIRTQLGNLGKTSE